MFIMGGLLNFTYIKKLGRCFMFIMGGLLNLWLVKFVAC
jgi:hypothetical protein